MVRRTKYFTQEERLAGRRELEAERSTLSSTKASRNESNHHAYCKRKIHANANVNVDQRIDFWGRIPAIFEDEEVFTLFRDGESILPFTEQRNITVADLDALSIEAPYPSDFLDHPSFMELWDDALHAALWGHHTRLYLVDLEREIIRCRQLSSLEISNQRRRQFDTLVQCWMKLWRNKLRFAKAKDKPSAAVTRFHIRWTARRILWTVLDLKALEAGTSALESLLHDRLVAVLTRVG